MKTNLATELLPSSTRRKPQIAPQRTVKKTPHLYVELTHASGSNFYTGLDANIHEGGIFVATYDLKPEGTLVKLLARLPGGHTLETTGTVRWTREYSSQTMDFPTGMGIGFHHISPEDSKMVQDFAQTRESIYFEQF